MARLLHYCFLIKTIIIIIIIIIIIFIIIIITRQGFLHKVVGIFYRV